MSTDKNSSNYRLWKSRVAAARMAYRDGKLADAERLARRALLDTEQMDDSQFQLAVTLNYVALPCLASGRLSEAESLLTRAERIARSDSAAEYKQLLGSTLRHLSQLRIQQDKSPEAETLLIDAVEALQKALPDSAIELANCLCDMASMYLLRGEAAQAEPLVVEALKIFNSDTLGAGDDLNRAGFIYEACMNCDDEQQLEELFETFATKTQYNVGPRNPNLVRALRLYAEHLKKIGNKERLAQVCEQFSALQSSK